MVSTDPAAKSQSYLPQAQSVLDALSLQLEMNLESTEKAAAWSTDKLTQEEEEDEEDDDDDVEFKPGRTYPKLCRQLLNVRVWIVCYILLLLYHTLCSQQLCSQQLYAQMVSYLADGGAKLLKQEDDIAARMQKLRGSVPTTEELVAMVQEKKKKAAVEEVKQKVCGTSIQLVPVDTVGTVLLISM